MALHLSKHVFSFSRQLFISVMALFLTFVACFITFQYHREKDYKAELLNTQLQDYNNRLSDYFRQDSTFNKELLHKYVNTYSLKDLRITVITPQGEVLYDNLQKTHQTFKNHLNREEVIQALQKGSGYSINRLSESMGTEFFYSAQYYPDLNLIIRSALPYSVNLIKNLEADSHYLWFSAIVSLVFILIFYSYTKKLGTSILQLQDFALRADKNEPILDDITKKFPKNELGEISKHIIQIYHRLHRTKEALYIEREKLITHLQISSEGLGVFTKKKEEILANNLFKQYINFISDKNLSNTEDIFYIPELSPITNFILKNKEKSVPNEERRMSLNLNKGGRIFDIECIIFQDDSFEISINDVTQKEEQARMKKQLTQNIAHELKTPVSSIQGYLETIVNNPNLSREKFNSFLERSYAQSNRLTHLLQDISLLTRMEEAPTMAEKELVNLHQLMQSIINEVTMELEEKQIEVFNQLPANIQIQGNSSSLYSIFRNLTDNAIAYGGNNIQITIHCFREDDEFYYFSFADTGVGVKDEHLSRLFERFYRVDKGRSRKLGGTGLGLAIVKNVVILHGGSIFAKNNPKGGLEFIFTLRKGIS